MKVLTVIFASLCTVFSVKAAIDCNQVPKIDIHSCCKFPKMADPNLIAEIREKMGKFDPSTMNGVLYVCKLKQMIFEKLNIAKNGEFDEAAGIEYIQNHLKASPEWQEVAAKGVKDCHKGIDPHIDGIQGTTNFTKAECNMKYHIMTHCLDIHGFTHCPAADHSGTAECTAAQDFVKECKTNLPAMMEFSANIRAARKKQTS